MGVEQASKGGIVVGMKYQSVMLSNRDDGNVITTARIGGRVTSFAQTEQDDRRKEGKKKMRCYECGKKRHFAYECRSTQGCIRR